MRAPCSVPNIWLCLGAIAACACTPRPASETLDEPHENAAPTARGSTDATTGETRASPLLVDVGVPILEQHLTTLVRDGHVGADLEFKADYCHPELDCHSRESPGCSLKCHVFIVSPNTDDPRGAQNASMTIFRFVPEHEPPTDAILSKCSAEKRNCQVSLTAADAVASLDSCEVPDATVERARLVMHADSERFAWLIGDPKAKFALVDSDTGALLMCSAQSPARAPG